MKYEGVGSIPIQCWRGLLLNPWDKETKFYHLSEIVGAVSPDRKTYLQIIATVEPAYAAFLCPYNRSDVTALLIYLVLQQTGWLVELSQLHTMHSIY